MEPSLNHAFKIMVVIVGFFFLFFAGMKTFVLAQVGSGKLPGGHECASGGSNQRTATSQQSPRVMTKRPPVAQPQQPSAEKGLLSDLGSGFVGGMLGSMLIVTQLRAGK